MLTGRKLVQKEDFEGCVGELTSRNLNRLAFASGMILSFLLFLQARKVQARIEATLGAGERRMTIGPRAPIASSADLDRRHGHRTYIVTERLPPICHVRRAKTQPSHAEGAARYDVPLYGLNIFITEDKIARVPGDD